MKLGFGIMRLPQNEEGKVDEQEGIDLIRYAIDHGIQYIDTGYTYHGGTSETIIGKALKDGYREKVILADKMPIWFVESEEDLEKYFTEQMQRLDVDCIDRYLIHNVITANWKITQKYNAFPFLKKKQEEGLIKEIGFSFHGDYDLFREVIEAHPWDFCQIQLNYVDKDTQATLKGLEYANQKGLDVVVMEPLKGGRLTGKIPSAVQEIWDRAVACGVAPAERTPAEWGLKWVASQKGVSYILSGMNTYEQLDENIALFSRGDFAEMSEEENAIVEEAGKVYNSLIKYGCTDCEYCLPCPKEIRIPKIIDFLNAWFAYDRNPSTKEEYLSWLRAFGSDCVGCKACEAKCPQGLPIASIMEEAVEEFGK